MNYPPDTSIWATVQQHRWKYARRSLPIRLLLIHSIRGNTTMELQDDSARNWFMSKSNWQEGEPPWASMASNIISADGQKTEVVPDDFYPTWSAGHMDPIAISYELAQPTEQPPYTEACVDRTALEVAKACIKYDIPPKVLPFVSGDNHEAPGIARHDRSANGKKWGKTDPGPQFNDRNFEKRVKAHIKNLQEGDPLSEAEKKELRQRRVVGAIIKNLLDGKFQDAANGIASCLGVRPTV